MTYVFPSDTIMNKICRQPFFFLFKKKREDTKFQHHVDLWHQRHQHRFFNSWAPLTHLKLDLYPVIGLYVYTVNSFCSPIILLLIQARIT